MYIKRKIDTELLEWMSSPERKPLLIRGARQVGKSTAVRELAKHFTNYIEVNFDESPTLNQLFSNGLGVDELLDELALITRTEISDGRTLLFLDEVQSCIPAISMLRYFYERRPNLHVIAAGSLLEFALAELPSFGVGRVRSLFMYPLSFHEFLGAVGEEALAARVSDLTHQRPLSPLIHDKLCRYVKKFLIVGGMPEVVRQYAEGADLLEVQRILDDLVVSVQADFVKYKKQVAPRDIQSVFQSVVQQVGSKFKYASDAHSMRAAQVKQIIDLLELAGLVQRVSHSDCNGIPLGAEINPKKFKLLILDTGIYQRLLGLSVSDLLLNDAAEVVNKGSIAELFVGLELTKSVSCYQKASLYYWHREAQNSQAEVDYVVQHSDQILPIEVKAGTKGAMRSMWLFLEAKNIDRGIRLSLEPLAQYPSIEAYPLYAVPNIYKG